ncbi:hypothetical protein HYU50_00810 [Candidatus Woesearchaeota archaeon]|nr:hypothetical protein [Candidatus Woesearchaeota archaeon]
MQKLYSVADRLEGRLAAGTNINLLPGSVHTVTDYAMASLQQPIPYSIDFAGNSKKQVLDVCVDYSGGVLITGEFAAADIQKAIHTSQIALRPQAAIYHDSAESVDVLCTAKSIFNLGQDYPFDGMFARRQVFSDPNRPYLTEIYAPINFQRFPEEILVKIRELDIEKNQLIIWLGAGTGSSPSDRLNTLAFISAIDQSNNKLGVLILESKIGCRQKP